MPTLSVDRMSAPSPSLLRACLVAHRGDPARFPENSLRGFRAALEAGARYVETDIQMTADGVAVLSHDLNLLRLTGHDLIIPRTPYEHLYDLAANEPGRFGSQHAELRIGTLEAFVELLLEWPDVHAFIEIKAQSYAVFGPAMIDNVLARLAPIAMRCTLISSSVQVLETVALTDGVPGGWVLPGWNDDVRSEAERLDPAILFIHHKRLPAEAQPLWPGAWRWAVYTINRAQVVHRLARRGVDLVETDNISSLLVSI
ncbi:MAG: glycerophosphodiester phosphodiesterase family protein [Candidatus Thiodiazotropha sp.]